MDPSILGRITADDKKKAKEFAKLGIPPAAAIALGRSRGGAKAAASLGLGSLKGGGTGNQIASTGKTEDIVKAQKARFKQGSDIRGKSKKNDPFAKFRKKRGKKTSSVDIESFASKATGEAEIRQDNGKNIFDIISYRYKMSAWREFSDSFATDQPDQ